MLGRDALSPTSVGAVTTGLLVGPATPTTAISTAAHVFPPLSFSTADFPARRVFIGDGAAFVTVLLGVHAVVTSYDRPNFVGAHLPVPTNLNLQQWGKFVSPLTTTSLFNFYSLGFPQVTRDPYPPPPFTTIPPLYIITLMWQLIFSKSSGREPCWALSTNPLSFPGLKPIHSSLGPRRTLICTVSSWIYPGLPPGGQCKWWHSQRVLFGPPQKNISFCH